MAVMRVEATACEGRYTPRTSARALLGHDTSADATRRAVQVQTDKQSGWRLHSVRGCVLSKIQLVVSWRKQQVQQR